ncbi:hypothetical protein [Evansella tamaricis]|uniref:Uncharacterized protein n=1 Tax=Evansella tamaricis TaxID=2069301 RepID=A0ABS6JB82_9BACI|nr:hypothetical protein [Evansella tamaricis]MBU9710942.1 hypothetical protein [Evansella tamaricis]
MNPFNDEHKIKENLQRLSHIPRNSERKQTSWEAIQLKTARLSRWNRIRKKLLDPVVIGPVVAAMFLFLIIPPLFNLGSSNDETSSGGMDGGVPEDTAIRGNLEMFSADDSDSASIEESEAEESDTGEYDYGDTFFAISHETLENMSFNEFYQWIKQFDWENAPQQVEPEFTVTVTSWLKDLEEDTKLAYMGEIIETAHYIDPRFSEYHQTLLFDLLETEPTTFFQETIDTGDLPFDVYSIFHRLIQYGADTEQLWLIKERLQQAGDNSLLLEESELRIAWNDLMAEISRQMYTGSLVEEVVRSKSAEILKLIQANNYLELSEFVHPEKGVRLSEYDDVVDGLVFQKNEVEGFLDDRQRYTWSSEIDGSYTVHEYIQRYVLTYKNQGNLSFDRTEFNQSVSNHVDLVTIYEVFPEGVFVEYFSSEAGETAEEWQALRFVFEEFGDDWYLVAVTRAAD